MRKAIVRPVHLYHCDECDRLDASEVKALYRRYVSRSHVRMLSALGSGGLTVERAEGMTIETDGGRRILDFTGGVGALNHGHNHPRLLAARAAFQRRKNMEVSRCILSPYVAALSHNIAQLLPEDLNVSFFCNSGAEAVEGAVKTAYKHHGGRRSVILRADVAYHGKLLLSGGLTGDAEAPFRFPTIPNIGVFRYGDIVSVVEQVRRYRNHDGTSAIYAIIVEPFNATHVLACGRDFLTELRAICDREGIVLIFDEAHSGWGRTGEMFSFLSSGAAPDIVTLSKGLGGGKASISCFTCREELWRRAWDRARDFMLHCASYSGFGEECVTAIEAIDIAVEDDYPAEARRIGGRLATGLQRLRMKYPETIDEVRGRGAHWGVMLHQPEPPAAAGALLSRLPGALLNDPGVLRKLLLSAVIAEMLQRHDVLVHGIPNRDMPLILSPALIATDKEVDRCLNALDQTLARGRTALLTAFFAHAFQTQIRELAGV
jgi:putrescine aminotransferase